LETRIAVISGGFTTGTGTTGEVLAVAKINKVCVGESLVGEGNEVAHVDLLIGPRGSAVETAFCNALTNNKDGFTTLLAVVAPNLACKPNTILFNKVTIKGAKQAVQMFGPAQYAVAKAVADSVADGVIPADEADDLFICVGVFIHWQAEDDAKIQDFNYRATKEALERAVKGWPAAREVTDKRNKVKHPFSAAA
jgi:5,6,7,8-tetrahydromethanopterin hydro-lyase